MKVKSLIIAKHLSTLSKDKSTKVSAVMSNEYNNIVAVGYNGLPRGFDDNVNVSRDKLEVYEHINDVLIKLGLKNKLFSLNYVDYANILENMSVFYKYHLFEHAERNLIFNYIKSKTDLDKNMLLTTSIETAEDARAIITSGFKNVCYYYLGKKPSEILTEDDAINNLFEILHILYLLSFSDVDYVDLYKFENGMAKISNPEFYSVGTTKNQEGYSLKFLLKVLEYYHTFNNICEDKEMELNDENQYFCAILKPDFSVLNLSFKGISPFFEQKFNGTLCYPYFENKTYLMDLVKLSAIKNSLYSFAQNFIAKQEYEVSVTLMPCAYCSIALIASGVKKVVFNNSIFNPSTVDKWQADFEKTKILFKFCDVEISYSTN